MRVLQHFFLGLLDRERYIEEFTYNYGAWTRDLAGRLWDERSSSAGQFGVFPLSNAEAYCRDVAWRHSTQSRSCRDGARPLRECAPDGNSLNVCRRATGRPTRSQSGEGTVRRPAADVPLWHFRHLRESKRILTVLRAFGEARRSAPDIGLLIAGGSVPSDLQRAMEPLIAQPGVVQTGFSPEREFWVNAHAVDACTNLRYPPAGESSSITVRLMGIAKPVIVTAGAETSMFPDSACLRVDSGAGEQHMLREFLVWLGQHRRMHGRSGGGRCPTSTSITAANASPRSIGGCCWTRAHEG